MHFTSKQLSDIYADYEAGIKVRDISKRYGCSTTTLYTKMREAGYHIKTNAEAHKSLLVTNDDVFSDFTREEDAYWYGFLLGDGNLSKVGNRISLTLAVIDEPHLVKFGKYLGYTDKPRPVRFDANQVIFRSESIANRLRKQGYEPAKSTKEKLPSFGHLHGESSIHFWRGMIDSDGTMGLYGRSVRVGLIGSVEIINGFRDFCNANLSLKGEGNAYTPTRSPSVRTIFYHSEDALKVLRLLYKDSTVYLDRKFKLANELLTLQSRFDDKNENRYVGFSEANNRWRITATLPDYNYSKTGVCARITLGSYKTKEEAIAIRDEFLDLYNELKAA